MNFEEQVLSELRAIRNTLNELIKNNQPVLSEDDKRQLETSGNVLALVRA